MRHIMSISAAIAFAAFTATPALADCPEATGSVNKHAGIAKDGTHAPLEGNSGSQLKTGSSSGTTTTSSDALPKTPQKDGSNLPVGESSDLATSGQDVLAQQKGGKTAAATAQDKCN